MTPNQPKKFRRVCWAASLGGCNPISREHVLSAGVALALGKDYMKVRMSNGATIISESAKPRILCKRHNEELSVFDSEAQRLFAAVSEYHQGARERLLVSRGSPTEKRVTVNGWNLERWMLKTFLNSAIFSASTRSKSNELRHAWGRNLVDYLYKEKQLPDGWGMYGFPSGVEYSFGGKIPAGRIFGLVIQTSGTMAINISNQPGIEKFDTPMWHYMRFFGMNWGFVGNVSTFTDRLWLQLLAGTKNDPRKHAKYRPLGFAFQRAPPEDLANEAMTRLAVTLNWEWPKLPTPGG